MKKEYYWDWLHCAMKEMTPEMIELKYYLKKISKELYGIWVGRLYSQLEGHGIRSLDGFRNLSLEEIGKWRSIGEQALNVARVAQERLKEECRNEDKCQS